MAARVLVMFAVMALELGAGIAAILATISQYSYPSAYNQRDQVECTAICVSIGAGVVMAWLLTMAFTLRKSARAKANRMLDEARGEAARILGEATEKALALSSLDAGRCRHCGNPRTGKFCPKCGHPAGGAGSA
ncbi:MAG: hypothetical protein NTU53_25830 [Planctomycetota bacterium]|nr:hypothetical protein [Planctomycetota bacterium]